jgi:glycosyltransferase involved in cell wall biosynthesis
MDGIEWKRSKWNRATRQLMKYFERITVRRAPYLVSDNEGIRDYYKTTFQRDSFFIAYGAEAIGGFDASTLSAFGLQPEGYFLCIARLEPENNIEAILDGYCSSGRTEPFVVIGNYGLKFGQYLRDKYAGQHVLFLGALYEKANLDNLRHFTKLYFHGHSVGGTNPSLLEAMAAGCPIAAHRNPFNRSVLGDNALFFSDNGEVKSLLVNLETFDESMKPHIQANYNTLQAKYSWKGIISAHEQLFSQIKSQSTNEKNH